METVDKYFKSVLFTFTSSVDFRQIDLHANVGGVTQLFVLASDTSDRWLKHNIHKFNL